MPLIRKSTYPGVILNVTSEQGSNFCHANPEETFVLHPVLTAYNCSKAALNSYTIGLAHELKEEGIKVNAVTPGHTSTKMSHFTGQTARAGAEVLLPWALLEKDGPTSM